MKITRKTTMTMITALLAATWAPAATYEFLGDDTVWGDGESWGDPNNWDPPGTPGANDHAIIPDGKHCDVQGDWQHAKTIEIEDGGTLTIKNGYWLKVGSTDEDTTSTINGEINFEGTASSLVIEQSDEEDPARTVTFQSTDQDGGLIIARGASSYAGKIDWNH